MAVRVSSDSFEEEVLKSELPVLADFYSDSCVPCKRLSPVLSQIEQERSDSLKVVKINVNFEAELAEKYDVHAAPTLVYFKNGAESARLVGAVKKSEIEEILV